MDHLDEILQVDTPENVAFGYEVAGIGSRFLAALVDTFLLVVINLFFSFLAVLLARYVIQAFGSVSGGEAWLTAVFGLISFAFFWGYYIFFEMLWNGQSPGKRWAKLRVMRVDGLPITLGESVIRNLIRLVDFLPFAYGLGVVTMFVNPQARRLGDLAAGTLVVRDRKPINIQDLKASQAATPAELLAIHTPVGNYPVERLTAQDLRVIADFLGRREQLRNRSQLALQISRLTFERMGIDPQPFTPIDAERFLIYIDKSTQARVP